MMSYVQQLRMEKEEILVISGTIYIFQPQKSNSGKYTHFLIFIYLFIFFLGGGVGGGF